MKYMMLVVADEYPSTPDGMPPGCDGWSEEMEKRGVLEAGGILRPPPEATTVLLRGGKLQVSDGPFAESKELIAGFNVIDCTDLDEAIEIAAKHPVAAFGKIELRPLWE